MIGALRVKPNKKKNNGILPEECFLPLRNGDLVTNDFWSYNDCLDGNGQATQLKIHKESKNSYVLGNLTIQLKGIQPLETHKI